MEKRISSVRCSATSCICGIAFLGYDHTEIMGNTLGAIAGEKAGIFKVFLYLQCPNRQLAEFKLKVVKTTSAGQ
ncbi:hypothetical protein L1987_72242 [Smallanthus sonchifolius]|uniref:Uncharacterized protein n=1 Tax=Smallanthus sonchifolius TaxID=185202 RepID=A0ACB9AU99_9ASTR|nr:hypothetical protein L1987_72242 [Smallanthus sonchifolius]